LNYKDEYAKKSGHTPDNDDENSGAFKKKKKHSTETDRELEREVEEKAEAKATEHRGAVPASLLEKTVSLDGQCEDRGKDARPGSQRNGVGAQDVRQVFEDWNAFAEKGGWAKALHLDDSKRRLIATRLKDAWWREHYAEALQAA